MANAEFSRSPTGETFRMLFEPASANIPKVDRRLVDIVRIAAANFPYEVRVRNLGGNNWHQGGAPNHPKGHAIDVDIYVNGKVLPNEKNADTFRIYEQFAQVARAVQQLKYPELNGAFRWGGYFSEGKSKRPEDAHPYDQMHLDISGSHGLGMNYGSWSGGLNDAGQRGLPGAVSVGMAAGLPSIDLTKGGTGNKPEPPNYEFEPYQTDVHSPIIPISGDARQAIPLPRPRPTPTGPASGAPQPVAPAVMPTRPLTRAEFDARFGASGPRSARPVSEGDIEFWPGGLSDASAPFRLWQAAPSARFGTFDVPPTLEEVRPILQEFSLPNAPGGGTSSGRTFEKPLLDNPDGRREPERVPADKRLAPQSALTPALTAALFAVSPVLSASASAPGSSARTGRGFVGSPELAGQRPRDPVSRPRFFAGPFGGELAPPGMAVPQSSLASLAAIGAGAPPGETGILDRSIKAAVPPVDAGAPRAVRTIRVGPDPHIDETGDNAVLRLMRGGGPAGADPALGGAAAAGNAAAPMLGVPGITGQMLVPPGPVFPSGDPTFPDFGPTPYSVLSSARLGLPKSRGGTLDGGSPQPAFPSVWGVQPEPPRPTPSLETIELLERRAGRPMPDFTGSRYDGGFDRAQPLPPDKEVTFYDPRVASTFPARPDFPAPNQPRGMNLRDVLAALTGIPDAIFGEKGPLMSASRALNGVIDGALNGPAAPSSPGLGAPTITGRSFDDDVKGFAANPSGWSASGTPKPGFSSEPPAPATITPEGEVVWDPYHVLDHNKDQSRHPAFPPVVPGAPSMPPVAAIPPRPTPISLTGSASIGIGARPPTVGLTLPSKWRSAAEVSPIAGASIQPIVPTGGPWSIPPTASSVFGAPASRAASIAPAANKVINDRSFQGGPILPAQSVPSLDAIGLLERRAGALPANVKYGLDDGDFDAAGLQPEQPSAGPDFNAMLRPPTSVPSLDAFDAAQKAHAAFVSASAIPSPSPSGIGVNRRFAVASAARTPLRHPRPVSITPAGKPAINGRAIGQALGALLGGPVGGILGAFIGGGLGTGTFGSGQSIDYPGAIWQGELGYGSPFGASQFRPSDFNAPDFNQTSGGSRYAYKPNTGWTVDQYGNRVPTGSYISSTGKTITYSME